MKNKLAYISLLVIALSLSVILFWLISPPSQAIDIKKLPVPIIKSPVQAGDYVTLHFDYCKNVKSSGRLTITLVSEKSQLSLPTTTENVPKGCSVFNAPLAVPPQTTPDVYHYHFRVVYTVNPLRSITQDWDTASFTVE